MAKNFLDLDRVPTIEELREFFYENDFSTATYRDIDYDKMDADDVETLEYIKGLMGEKWDVLSRDMGLKQISFLLGHENCPKRKKGPLDTVKTEGENPEGSVKIYAQISLRSLKEFG